jgi:hypothetical protein
MVAGVGVIDTTGFGLTVTVVVAVPVHPREVPVTVYAVVVAGVTTSGFAVPSPPLQLYVVAPLAASDEEAPLHMVAGVGTIDMESVGFTVTVTVAVPVQPEVVPVTV